MIHFVFMLETLTATLLKTMTIARKHIIDFNIATYYHCFSRCVRRAFLCGKDKFSGKSYEHRKKWIIDRLAHLSNAFAIDVATYAIMSNHYHLILHVDIEKAKSWTTEEVISRWLMLYKGPPLVRKFNKNHHLTQYELQEVYKLSELYRERLLSISEFMKCLNQKISQQANHEDNCKGHFWEGRFKSQALLDETALLTCMIYVDLNPIRSKIHKDLISSKFTSIRQRLLERIKFKINKRKNKKRAKFSKKIRFDNSKNKLRLQSFQTKNKSKQTNKNELPFTFIEYLRVITWSCKKILNKNYCKKTPPALYGINPTAIFNTIIAYSKLFKLAVGPINKIKEFAKKLGKKWIFGQKGSQYLYSN